MHEGFMNGMMGSGIMWGGGVIGLLIIVLLVLGIAALAKYLFSDRS
jgi:hypothetical protein